jgi:hypothetical protein
MTTTGRCPRCGGLESSRRRDAFVAGHEAGRVEGFREAAALRAEVGVPAELSDLWPALVKLVHPDVHAPARQADAHEVTVALLAWRERRRGR